MNTAKIEEKAQNYTTAIILEIAGCIGWGLSYVFIKQALSVAPEAILLGTRFLLAFLMLNLCILFRAGKIERKKRKKTALVFLCVTEVFYFIFETVGLKYVTITCESVLLATTPIFAMIFAYILLREVPTKRQIVCCICAVFGVIIVSLSGKDIGAFNPLGIVFIILACISAALYRTFNKIASKEYSFFERTYFVIGSCMIGYIIMALREVHGDLALWYSYVKIPEFIIPTAILAFLCSFLGQFFINLATQTLSLVVFSIIALSNTIIAVLSGVLISGDRLSPQVSFGIGLTLLSMLGVSISIRKLDFSKIKGRFLRKTEKHTDKRTDRINEK